MKWKFMGWARTGQGGIHDRPEIDMIGCAPHTIVLANSCWKLWHKVTPRARLTKIILSRIALHHLPNRAALLHSVNDVLLHLKVQRLGDE